MTMPTLIVEFGFTALSTGTALHLDDPMRGRLDTATLAAGDLFTDVTPWAVSARTRRGATRSDGPTLRYEAGTCTITLRNDDRRFDPTNLAGPYVAGGVTQVEPLRAVRIRASYNGQTWPLWRGFTNEWSVNYDGPNSSYATVTCFDAFGIFAAYDRGAIAPVGSGETTGARINRVLDSIGWPAEDRMVATGEESVQSTTLAGNVLTELLLTADTELGEFWIDAEGRVRFRARSASYTATRSAYPLALFGDQVDDGVDTTVNLITNPSSEAGITGWLAGGFANQPTLSQSSTRAMFGTYSLLATWATASSADIPLVNYTVTGLTSGRTYTFSVYAWVPAGSPSVVGVLASTGPWGTGTSGVTDQWVRLTLTTTVGSSSVGFQVWPENSTTTAGQQVWLDGFQVEESPTVTAYVDGDQALCEWDGVPHDSTSRRLPELDYGDLTLTYDALGITNQVSAANVGGTEQTATDSGSVSAYLTRSHQRTDLLLQTDAEALMWAEQVLARRSMPELRVSALLLKPAKDPDRLWAQAYGREIGDRVRVVRRPPGGGAPIVREAWVRGIEHDLSKDLAWRTTLVLEQARDVTAIVDNFNRVTAAGWGTAYSGQVWTTTGGSASDYSTTGAGGRHTHTAANVLHHSLVTVGTPNAEVLADVTIAVGTPSGAPITCWVVARGVDINNYYYTRLDIAQTTAAATLIVAKRVAAATSGLASAVAVGTHTAGATWRVRFGVVGSTVRAKAWLTTGSEPANWQVTATDTALTAGTLAGVLSRFESGNSNTLPQNIDWDNLSATSLHAWA